jgi:hypothetical protein
MTHKQKASDRFLHSLMHEAYWTRAWIIQEVAMASSSLRVCYGSESVPWDNFMKWVIRHRDKNPEDIAINKILELDQLRQLRNRPGEILTLTKLLYSFKDAFSTKAHDKIYAFLGLAHDCSATMVPVDYDKSVSDVYHDMVNFYWHYSAFSQRQKSIELIYFSALVRRLLAREKEQCSTMITGQSNVSFGTLSRKITKAEKKSTWITFSKVAAVLTGVGAVIDPFIGSMVGLSWCIWSIGYLFETVEVDVHTRWHWKASKPENISLWIQSYEDSRSFSELSERGKGMGMGKADASNTLGDFVVRGIDIGKVNYVGPPCVDVVNSQTTDDAWRTTLDGYPSNLEARKHVLKLNTKLLGLLDRPDDYCYQSLASHDALFIRKADADEQFFDLIRTHQFPRVFLGSNGLIGIVSAKAQEGDVICQFWNSSICAVLRLKKRQGRVIRWLKRTLKQSDYEVIGRAAIIRDEGDGWDISTELGKELFSEVNDKAIDIPITMADLTRLSLDTIHLPVT